MTIKNTKTKNDIEDKISVVKIIQDIDYRLTHLEDIQMDNRELIVKLVKQGNTIVQFLKKYQTTELDSDESELDMNLPLLTGSAKKLEKTEGLKNLIDDILDRQESLKDFEDELKKHKDKITPGQVGES